MPQDDPAVSVFQCPQHPLALGNIPPIVLESRQHQTSIQPKSFFCPNQAFWSCIFCLGFGGNEWTTLQRQKNSFFYVSFFHLLALLTLEPCWCDEEDTDGLEGYRARYLWYLRSIFPEVNVVEVCVLAIPTAFIVFPTPTVVVTVLVDGAGLIL